MQGLAGTDTILSHYEMKRREISATILLDEVRREIIATIPLDGVRRFTYLLLASSHCRKVAIYFIKNAE